MTERTFIGLTLSLCALAGLTGSETLWQIVLAIGGLLLVLALWKMTV